MLQTKYDIVECGVTKKEGDLLFIRSAFYLKNMVDK